MQPLLNIFPVATLWILSACDFLGSDSKPQLPPVTTEGRGTFGCFVNGELFLADAPLGYGTGVFAELETFPDTLGLFIYASNSNAGGTLVIYFFGSPTLEVGKSYDLAHHKFSVDYIKYNSTTSCRYQSVISGSIKLLKFNIANPEHMIVAGTFEFVETSIDCQDTVVVTSGRFDINDVTYQ